MSSISLDLLSEGVSFEKEIVLKERSYINENGQEVDLKLTVGQKLCNLAHLNKVVGFIDDNKDCYICVRKKPTADEYIIFPLKSGNAKDYFRIEYYNFERSVLSDKSLDSFLGTLAAMCKTYAQRQHHVFRRVGMKDDKIYIDLCNSQNEFVEVDAEGYRIIKNPPVIFIRSEDVLPLPTPEQGVDKEKVEQLMEFINCEDLNNFRLVICYIIHLFFPENYAGAKVILALEGNAGSAKSTFTRIIKLLVDPSYNGLISTPQSIQDLYICAKSCWILALDNMSKVSQELSNALCKISTGATYTSRKLFTNEDQSNLNVKRPIIVNGISDYLQREDVIDRCLMFNLQRINYRRPENELWQKFESSKCEIFSAILGILSGTLKMLPQAYVCENFRMADFAKIGKAVELHMGWNKSEESYDFSFIYRRNLKRMASNNLHQNVISSSLIHFLKCKHGKLENGFELKMTPHELFKALKNQNLSKDFANPEFPNDVSAFSKELVNNLAPTFQKVGISITRSHSTMRYILVKADAGSVDEKLI